jgi:DNA polymerase III sliding clamp (beta) subunit (PCNA family)
MSEVKTEGDTTCISMDAEMFRDLFNLASALILSEVQVQIKDDGLYVQQMEETKVAMTIMFVPKTYFRELRQGKVIKELRFDVQGIRGILTRLSHGDVITFTVSSTGKLHIEITGKRMRVFDMPLLEVVELERRVPRVPFNVRAKTTLEGILDAIEDAKKLITRGESKSKKNTFGMVTFVATSMGLKIVSTTEDELYSTYTTLTSGWDLMKFEGSIDQHATIGITYLAGVIAAISKVTNMVQLEYTTNMPVHIIVEMPLKGVNLEYYFAPRVLEVKEVKKK